MSIFTQTPVKGVPTNQFDLSHEVKMSLDAGHLVPICCTEVLPGDSIKYKPVTMVRLAPMVAPVMHKMDVSTFSFFVPVRLLWDGYEKFFQSPIPTEDTPVAPYFNNISISPGTLGDYLGLPTTQSIGADGTVFTQYSALSRVSALPFAAYQKIYNDYFRDQNLVNNAEPYADKLNDGLNNFSLYSDLRKRAWQHDYFTSALPFAQKGDPVEIPMGTEAPIVYEDTQSSAFWRTVNGVTMGMGTNTVDFDQDQPAASFGKVETANTAIHYDPAGTLHADLSQASAVTINTLRWAIKLQEFLEKNARGGTRYIELMRQHFGVKSSDARLQRAEFIGSTSNPVVISEVLQTSSSEDGTTPQGEMAGHGLSVGSSKSRRYYAEEHGFFITLANIRPKTAYSQGIAKMWTRETALDYAYPTFAHLGEQEVLSKELYFSGDPENDESVFGYLPRYAEYRYENNRVAGEFRTSLAFWHMGRQFSSVPTLSQSFIEANPTKRIFAVNNPGTHSYYMHVNNILQIRRKLPKFGIPAI